MTGFCVTQNTCRRQEIRFVGTPAMRAHAIAAALDTCLCTPMELFPSQALPNPFDWQLPAPVSTSDRTFDLQESNSNASSSANGALAGPLRVRETPGASPPSQADGRDANGAQTNDDDAEYGQDDAQWMPGKCGPVPTGPVCLLQCSSFYRYRCKHIDICYDTVHFALSFAIISERARKALLLLSLGLALQATGGVGRRRRVCVSLGRCRGHGCGPGGHAVGGALAAQR